MSEDTGTKNLAGRAGGILRHRIAAASRTAVGAVHLAAAGLCLLVLATGRLTLPAAALWLALCAAADQVTVWPLWIVGGRQGPNPLKGWNW